MICNCWLTDLQPEMVECKQQNCYILLLNSLKQVKSQSKFVEETNMEDNKSMTVKKTVKSGITFGSALAMVISYTTWKSVGWAIFHGLLSWVYVIYFLLRY